jgi:hypothetical protein
MAVVVDVNFQYRVLTESEVLVYLGVSEYDKIRKATCQLKK